MAQRIYSTVFLLLAYCIPAQAAEADVAFEPWFQIGDFPVYALDVLPIAIGAMGVAGLMIIRKQIHNL